MSRTSEVSDLCIIMTRELFRRALLPTSTDYERLLQAPDPPEIVEWLQSLSDDELQANWRDQHRILIQHLMAKEAVKKAIMYQSIHPLEGRTGSWKTLGQL